MLVVKYSSKTMQTTHCIFTCCYKTSWNSCSRLWKNARSLRFSVPYRLIDAKSPAAHRGWLGCKFTWKKKETDVIRNNQIYMIFEEHKTKLRINLNMAIETILLLQAEALKVTSSSSQDLGIRLETRRLYSQLWLSSYVKERFSLYIAL